MGDQSEKTCWITTDCPMISGSVVVDTSTSIKISKLHTYRYGERQVIQLKQERVDE